MIGIDTNVLARLYVDDPSDPEAAPQQAVAVQVFSDAPSLFVPVTVILELEWVVRSFYGFDVAAFARVVRHLSGLPNVLVEDRERVLDAVAVAEAGLDFADALHVVRCGACDRFLTFDRRRFARRAAKAGVPIPVEVPTSAG